MIASNITSTPDTLELAIFVPISLRSISKEIFSLPENEHSTLTLSFNLLSVADSIS